MAVRDPDRVGLIDELGALTFGELHRRSNALARALAERGVARGRQRRGDVPQPPRLRRRLRRHRQARRRHPAASTPRSPARSWSTCSSARARRSSIHDEEFTGLLEQGRRRRRGSSAGSTTETDDADIDRVADRGVRRRRPRRRPERHARIVILTSGTTGTPKGAPRSEAGIDAAVSLLSRMPLRYGWRTHIAAPLFHTWGFAHLALAMLLGSTVVLRRKFDPEGCLRGRRGRALRLARRDPGDAAADPDAAAGDARRATTCRRSRSSPPRARRCPATSPSSWMDHFGDNLYNIYGSTEVAYASIATPEDLREAPDLGRQAAVGDRREDPRRRRAASVPHGRVRPDLRRQRPALRGLHRRRRARRSSTG